MAPADPGASDDTFIACVQAACHALGPAARRWHVQASRDAARMWIHIRHERAGIPEQGWKLHVSAVPSSAAAVLRRALPVLLAEPAAFKVVDSIDRLSYLNEGFAGPSQVGKFITVYPRDDAQAVRLARMLHEATSGLRGPAVPSDRPLLSGSLVHYRYGGFAERHLETPLGDAVPAIRTPDGELIPDPRRSGYRAPPWAEDPFIAAGIAGPATPTGPLIGGRFLIVSPIHESARGGIYVAVDTETAQRCALKQARRDARLGLDGSDARDRLRHEASVLARIAPDPRFPAVIDLVEENSDLFLAMEHLEGHTLAQRVAAVAAEACFVPLDRVAAWGRELAAMLDRVHREGFVYRDLKSRNVIIGPDERLRLLDFELAYDVDAGTPLYPRGTRGYISPDQAAGLPGTVADDIYGFGALLYFLATAAEPSLAPHEFALLERPVRLINPAASPLEGIIARCLDADPSARFPSIASLDAALASLDTRAAVRQSPFGQPPDTGSAGDAQPRYDAAAERLGDAICNLTLPDAVDHSPASASSRFSAGGAILALAELVAAFGNPRHRAALIQRAEQLASAPHGTAHPRPGLYSGESAVGAALLRAGQVLGREDLIAEAARRGSVVASPAYTSPGMLHGAAGRLRFHLLLWDETADPEHLRHAIEAGQWLLRSAEHAGDGEVCWAVPSGSSAPNRKHYLGYAHGAAGIADALLDLAEASEGERFLTAARGAGRWLVRLAVPVLDDGSGVDWPPIEGQPPAGAMWCQGAAGIGRFFLHGATLGVTPEAATLAARAAWTVARGARWLGPTQCHGLAGGIEFLLDMYQGTETPAYLAEAQSLAHLLDPFVAAAGRGDPWPFDPLGTLSSDYLLGYAGLAVCMVRLADPERAPHQLSRAGFRHRPSPSSVATGSFSLMTPNDVGCEPPIAAPSAPIRR